jgi:hypothetical protein
MSPSPAHVTAATAERTGDHPIHGRAATITGVIAASIVLTCAFGANIDLLKVGLWTVERFSASRVDDIAAAVILVTSGLVVDRLRRERQFRVAAIVQAQRLRVLKATMRTVQDIVNTYLNSAQLIELEAGDALSPGTLRLLNAATRDTAMKLSALGNLASTPEIEMVAGTCIAY